MRSLTHVRSQSRSRLFLFAIALAFAFIAAIGLRDSHAIAAGPPAPPAPHHFTPDGRPVFDLGTLRALPGFSDTVVTTTHQSLKKPTAKPVDVAPVPPGVAPIAGELAADDSLDRAAYDSVDASTQAGYDYLDAEVSIHDVAYYGGFHCKYATGYTYGNQYGAQVTAEIELYANGEYPEFATTGAYYFTQATTYCEYVPPYTYMVAYNFGRGWFPDGDFLQVTAGTSWFGPY